MAPQEKEYVEQALEESEVAWHVLTVEEVIKEVRSMNWEQVLGHAIHTPGSCLRFTPIQYFLGILAITNHLIANPPILHCSLV
jgi:hypothetical protein